MKLNERERHKFHVINNTLLKYLTNVEAGTILSLSVRQIKRLKRMVDEYGVHGVVHGLKGKPGNHRKKS